MSKVLLGFILFLVGCSGAPKPLSAPRAAIIFVPGYYGSSLKTVDSGERFFITAGRYLFGSSSVSLHVRDLATPAAPDLVVDAVMDKVRVVPGVYSVDVYGRFMKRLRKIAHERHAEFVPFAYDWRQDLTESAGRLAEVVRDLKARGITDVEIVAHSMGCLVTTYYLGYGAQAPETARLDWSGAGEVRRAVLMAGPYRGAFSLFRNMQLGAKIGSNASYLPAETVASLPASYQLLPMRDFHLYDLGGRPMTFAVAEASAWERFGLGLMKDRRVDTGVRERRRAFVNAQLARANVLSERLEFAGDPPPATLAILQLVGYGTAVVNSAYHDPVGGGFVFDTQNLKKRRLDRGTLFADGDGSVTTASARLPAALLPRARVLTTSLVHDRVFDDEEFLAQLARF